MNCSVSPTSGQPRDPAGGRALQAAAVDRAASRRTMTVTSSAAATVAAYNGQETPPPAASGCMAAGVASCVTEDRVFQLLEEKMCVYIYRVHIYECVSIDTKPIYIFNYFDIYRCSQPIVNKEHEGKK